MIRPPLTAASPCRAGSVHDRGAPDDEVCVSCCCAGGFGDDAWGNAHAEVAPEHADAEHVLLIVNILENKTGSHVLLLMQQRKLMLLADQQPAASAAGLRTSRPARMATRTRIAVRAGANAMSSGGRRHAPLLPVSNPCSTDGGAPSARVQLFRCGCLLWLLANFPAFWYCHKFLDGGKWSDVPIRNAQNDVITYTPWGWRTVYLTEWGGLLQLLFFVTALLCSGTAVRSQAACLACDLRVQFCCALLVIYGYILWRCL